MVRVVLTLLVCPIEGAGTSSQRRQTEPPPDAQARDGFVQGLTKDIELLFKQTRSTTSRELPHRVAEYDFGASQRGRRVHSRSEECHVIIATGLEVTPFPGRAIEIDEEQFVSSTGTLSLQNV